MEGKISPKKWCHDCPQALLVCSKNPLSSKREGNDLEFWVVWVGKVDDRMRPEALVRFPKKYRPSQAHWSPVMKEFSQLIFPHVLLEETEPSIYMCIFFILSVESHFVFHHHPWHRIKPKYGILWMCSFLKPTIISAAAADSKITLRNIRDWVLSLIKMADPRLQWSHLQQRRHFFQSDGSQSKGTGRFLCSCGLPGPLF